VVKIGVHSETVKAVQEWLCYNKINVAIDSDFGPATLAGVKEFQKKKQVPQTGVVDSLVWDLLRDPITFLESLPELTNKSISDTIVINAIRHYVVCPIEIGGQNLGPFVRFYMKGEEGTEYPWCAGAVSTIVLQSFQMLNRVPKNFRYQMSCDLMYADAKKFGTLVKTPVPGCLFLSYDPSNPSDCTHAGIITDTDISGGVVRTFEGNTNDSGSREGYEYVPRIRSLVNKYFINLGGIY